MQRNVTPELTEAAAWLLEGTGISVERAMALAMGATPTPGEAPIAGPLVHGWETAAAMEEVALGDFDGRAVA